MPSFGCALHNPIQCPSLPDCCRSLSIASRSSCVSTFSPRAPTRYTLDIIVPSRFPPLIYPCQPYTVRKRGEVGTPWRTLSHVFPSSRHLARPGYTLTVFSSKPFGFCFIRPDLRALAQLLQVPPTEQMPRTTRFALAAGCAELPLLVQEKGP
ncbi:hypothetical protein VUR80DRAFT_737 [Thermomyces stellatus]